MRKITFGLSLLGAIVVASAVNAAAPTSFAGTWMLDKSKSQGLSSRDQGADSVSWTITQTDKEITIEQKVTGGAMASGGGPGGPGGGGRGMGGGPRTYNLDGSETTAEMGRGKALRKASWSKDGKTLELSSKSTFQGQDGAEVTSTSNDKMQLSGDGKTLTVIRHSESPRGTQDTTFVFMKQ